EEEAEAPWPATQPERNAVKKRPEIVEDVAGGPCGTGLQTRGPAEGGRRYGNGHDRRGRHREGERRPAVRQAVAVLDCIDRDTRKGCRACAERDGGTPVEKADRRSRRDRRCAQAPGERNRQEPGGQRDLRRERDDESGRHAE